MKDWAWFRKHKKGNNEFLDIVRAHAREEASNRPITVDALRIFAANLGLRPSHPNVWGTVFNAPGFYQVGTLPSMVVSNRGRRVSAWGYKKP